MRERISRRSTGIVDLVLAASAVMFSSACSAPPASYITSLRRAQTSVDPDVTLDQKDPEASIMRRIRSEIPRSLYGEDRQGLKSSITGYYKVLLELNPRLPEELWQAKEGKLHGTIPITFIDMNNNGYFG